MIDKITIFFKKCIPFLFFNKKNENKIEQTVLKVTGKGNRFINCEITQENLNKK